MDMDPETPAPSLQQQVNWLQVQLTALATARDNSNCSGKGFRDAPIFDGGKAEELRTCMIQLGNKLAAQPSCFPNDQTCLRYAVNCLSGPALNMIHSYVSENTGRIRFDSLNSLLELLRQAYDDPDRTHTANRDIRKVVRKTARFQPTSPNLAVSWEIWAAMKRPNASSYTRGYRTRSRMLWSPLVRVRIVWAT